MSTPTPSLRRRVAGSVVGLFAVLLVVLGVFVDLALGAQLRHDLANRLADRLQRAEQLARAGTNPPDLVAQLQGQDIRVRLVTSDGRAYGDPGLGPLDTAVPGSPPTPRAPGAGPQPKTPPGPPTPPDATSSTVVRSLPGGIRLVLVADTTSISEVRTQLRWVMVAAGLAVLAVSAVLVLVVLGVALRPLDRLTALARRITSGDRGDRLEPDRPGSELGKAAVAIDEMLDALEHAERRATTAAIYATLGQEQAHAFLADAAHELRTPLAGIQVVAESVATASDGGTERQRRRARLLVRETSRAGRLVADMLDLARIEQGVELRCTQVHIATLVDAEIDRLTTLDPQLRVEHHTPRPGPLVTADPDRITQVLRNLVDNARRHAPPGGPVRISTDQQDGLVSVLVHNDGLPIAEADRERVFNRFVRLTEARDRDSGGAGLGLPIARGLARLHDGDVTCEPDGDGASFRLTLPEAGPRPV